MKKFIGLMFAVMLGASAAMGQGYTADWVVKSSNKLLYKVSERGNVIRMELPNEKGGIMPMLVFGKDSLCMLMPETKTYGVFTGEKMRGKTREMLGFERGDASSQIPKHHNYIRLRLPNLYHLRLLLKHPVASQNNVGN